MEEFHEGFVNSFVIPTVFNIEEDRRFDQTVLSQLGRIIAVLPCLEA